MAVMGLRINGNGGGSGLSGGISALAKALYGDPEREMKMAKLRSDLATDEYQRRQIAAAQALYEAKTAHQVWQTQSGQGGVAPAAKYLEDAVNAGRGAGIMPSPDAPVAVDVGPVAPAGPAYNTTMGPETFVSAFPARPAAISSNEMPTPVVDDVYSTFPARPGAAGAYQPGPAVRGVDNVPSTFPGRPDGQSSLLDYVPPTLGPFPARPGLPAGAEDPFGQMPVPVGPYPARPEGPSYGYDTVPQASPAIGPFPARPETPGEGLAALSSDGYVTATPGQRLSLTDLFGPTVADALGSTVEATPDQRLSLGGLLGLGDNGPAPVDLEAMRQPGPFPGRPTPSLGGAPAPVDLEALLRPGPFPGRVGPDIGGVEPPPELPGTLPGPFLGRPDLQGPDPRLLPGDVPSQGYPYQGVGPETNVPPQGYVAPGPFPARPGAPEGPTVPTPPTLPTFKAPEPAPLDPTQAEMPVPVEPTMAPGRQFQGPNLPVTRDGTITDPTHPQAPVVAVDTPQGPLPMTSDEYQAYAAMLIANGGDVAGALNRAAGGLAMTYGSLDNPARMRIAAQLMSGNMANRDTVVTAGDTAGTDQAIRLAQATEAAKPANLSTNVVNGQEYYRATPDGPILARNVPGAIRDLSKNYVTVDKIAYIPQEDGSLQVAPGQGDESGHLDGTSADIVAYNKLIDLNAKIDQGIELNPSELRAEDAAWHILNDPVTSSSLDAEGKHQISTIIKPPPGTIFRVPPGAATAAAAPTQAEQVTANRPVEPGQPITVVNLKTGKTEQVTNKWGGWTMPGEQPPAETHEVPTPGGGKAVISTYGDKKIGQMTESTTKNYRFFNEALPAAYDLDKILPGQEPSSFQRALEMFRQQGIKEEWLTNNYLDPETRSYARAMYTFINGFARPDSGATILPEEFKKYESRFVMPANAKLRDYVEVKANRAAALRAMRMTFNGQVPSEQLSDTDTQILRYGQDLDYRPETDPGYQRVLAAQKAREGGTGGAGVKRTMNNGSLN